MAQLFNIEMMLNLKFCLYRSKPQFCHRGISPLCWTLDLGKKYDYTLILYILFNYMYAPDLRTEFTQ